MKKSIIAILCILCCVAFYCAADSLLPGDVGSKKAQRVEFDDVDNCRQLGGYVNVKGEAIKSNVLIRSGKLSKLTSDGIAKLQEMNVTTVIDLRIPEEIAKHPDPDLKGVKNVRINLADPKSNFYKMSAWGVDVNKENYDSIVNAIAKLNMNLGEMYIEGIVESEYARKALKQVFSILTEQEEGAILWHCSGGKDRTGLIAALLLSVLEVDRETILNDYELTNDFVPGERFVMKLASFFWGDDEKEKERVATIAGVKRKFMEETLNHIDQQYGSPVEFLRNQVGVTEEEMQRIKGRYIISNK